MKAYFDELGYPRLEIEVKGYLAGKRLTALIDTGFEGYIERVAHSSATRSVYITL